MTTKLKDKEDLLSLVALGSVISTVVKAKDQEKIEQSHKQLQAMYHHLLKRYKLAYTEYQEFRDVTENLQKQVVVLRTENNKLLQKLATTGTKS